MNLTKADNSVTMTSLEISTLVDKRHDSVKRTIETLVSKGIIVQPQSVDEQSTDSMGRNRPTQVYVFNGEQGKRDSIIIVAQLSPEFTARLVDRWQELEAAQQPKIPQTYAEALQLAADQAKQLEQAKPKVQHYDAVVEREGLLNATQVAQKLGMSAIALNRHLEPFDVYSKAVKRSRTFKQWFIDKGLGEVKQVGDGYTQPLFTLKGEAWIIEKLISEGVYTP